MKKKHEEIVVPELEAIPDTMHRPWSEREMDVLRRYFPTKPTAAIARYLGRTTRSTSVKASDMGIKKVGYR